MSGARRTHAKGSRWRLICQRWLDGLGAETHYRSVGLPGDDVTARWPWLRLSVEAKDHQRIDLAAFVNQCNDNTPPGAIGLCMIKRKGKPNADDCYVVMSGWQFAALLEQLGGRK